MSWRDAPLYVHSHDLAVSVLSRLRMECRNTANASFVPILVETASGLVTATSLALTFPTQRAQYLHQADESVVRLRVLLRIAVEVGLLSARSHPAMQIKLLDIGRMIGGWKKRVNRQRARGVTTISQEPMDNLDISVIEEF